MSERLEELGRALTDSRRRLEAVAGRLASLRALVEGEEASARAPVPFEDEAGDESGPVDESELDFEPLDDPESRR
ncbi:MAG TPA: hypothetical protein VMU50_21805 [Polyangia bacterium]|jgi:hypothetical protein|nr:hypothetical protein [Polyangia bacterium]